MIERICHIDNDLEDSIFLFGARQTGKSTFLRHHQNIKKKTVSVHFCFSRKKLKNIRTKQFIKPYIDRLYMINPKNASLSTLCKSAVTNGQPELLPFPSYADSLYYAVKKPFPCLPVQTYGLTAQKRRHSYEVYKGTHFQGKSKAQHSCRKKTS